jgi:hypothetical protein
MYESASLFPLGYTLAGDTSTEDHCTHVALVHAATVAVVV